MEFLFIMRFKLNNSSNPPALRVVEKDDLALLTPNILAAKCQPNISIAAIIHVFYPELMPEIAQCLNNFECCPDLFISTDSSDKAEQIKSFCEKYPHWRVDIRVVANRGRDVAPMLVEFRHIFDQYQYCLHLHSKKTQHKSAVAKWREYLFYTLCGSKDIVASNLALLQEDKIGFVFAQNINVYRHNLSWGTRFENVKQLLVNSEINIFTDTLLEFPSSTMFFAKTAALRKLLKQNLQITDFDIENRQITATLAHDIETSLLYFVEASGHRWVKVSSNHGWIFKLTRFSDLNFYLDNVVPQLLLRRIDELKLLSTTTRRNGICNSVRQKLFNAWQKIFFRNWSSRSPFKFQIKNINSL